MPEVAAHRPAYATTSGPRHRRRGGGSRPVARPAAGPRPRGARDARRRGSRGHHGLGGGPSLRRARGGHVPGLRPRRVHGEVVRAAPRRLAARATRTRSGSSRTAGAPTPLPSIGRPSSNGSGSGTAAPSPTSSRWSPSSPARPASPSGPSRCWARPTTSASSRTPRCSRPNSWSTRPSSPRCGRHSILPSSSVPSAKVAGCRSVAPSRWRRDGDGRVDARRAVAGCERTGFAADQLSSAPRG
jgi:hypothetical protein